MKRSTKIILAIIILAGLSTPYFVGRSLETNFNNFLAKVNETGKNDFSVTGKFYRGIFTSTATTEITFKNSYTALQLAHFIKHGPVVFDFKGWTSPSTYIPNGFKMGQASTKFTGNIQEFINRIYASKAAYDCITDIAFNGDIATRFTNYPLETQIDKGVLKWQGATANFTADKNLDKAKIAMHMPMLEYTENLAPGFVQTGAINNIKLDYDQTSRGVQSAVKFSLDSAKITTNGKDELALQGFETSVNKKVANTAMDFDLVIKFAKAVLAEDVYGPLNLQTKVNNWKENVVNQLLMQQTEQLYQMPPLPNQTPALPGQMSQQGIMIPEASKATLLEALKQKVTMQTDLSFKTPDGDIIVKIEGEVGGPGITDATMEQIMPTLIIKENVQVSKKIVYKVLSGYGQNQVKNNEVEYYLRNRTSNIVNPYTMSPEALQNTVNDWINKLIAQLIAQNYIMDKDNNFVMDVNYANQILTINGAVKTSEDIQQFATFFQVIPPPAASPATPSTSTVPGTPTDSSTPDNSSAPGTTTPNITTPTPTPTSGTTAPGNSTIPPTNGNTLAPTTAP